MTTERLFIEVGKCIEIHNNNDGNYIRGDFTSISQSLVRVEADGGGIWQMERDGDLYKLRAVVGPVFTKELIWKLFPARIIPAIVGL